MQLPCSCHAVAMQYLAMPLQPPQDSPSVWHAVAMQLPCSCHAFAVHVQCTGHLQCIGHANPMQLRCICYAVAMQYLALPLQLQLDSTRSCHAVAMQWPCSCHAVAMHLPCICYAFALHLLFLWHALTIHLQCIWLAFAMHLLRTVFAIHLLCAVFAMQLACNCLHTANEHTRLATHDLLSVCSLGVEAPAWQTKMH